MGLARWRQAQRRIVASGAEVVLCGHDHQEGAELLGGRVVVSTAGTLCKRTRGGRPSTFNFVTIEPTAVQDRKSTRLNSSHSQISYAVFCLKKKKKKHNCDTVL